MKIYNQLLPNRQEIIAYDTPGIQLYTETHSLSQYHNMRSILHWHEDFELMHIISGQMYYCSDKKKILLKTNDSILVNSRRLHYYASARHEDCTFSCILIHPQMLTGNPLLKEHFIDPVLNNAEHDEFFLPRTHRLHFFAALVVKDAIEMTTENSYGYQLNILAQFQKLFYEITTMYNVYESLRTHTSDQLCLQNMIDFILLNYMNKISIDDIADAGCVSRSKCYELFKELGLMTPLSFLNDVRLKKAKCFLRDSKLKVIDIAEACGFNYCNYFSQMFKKTYGVTPNAFRKKIANNAIMDKVEF